jgi:sulfur relay (sulfurtransferase) DsrC/TusE family protein
MAEGQEEGHESEWQQSNTRNLPYLRYKPVALGEQQAPPPQRATIDSNGMSLSIQAMQEADRFIQATTSVYDPSLGRDNPRDKSGKAILALQQQSDAGTSHFLASLADVSMPLEARIVVDLMPAIYDRPGRITTIVRGDDDEAEHVMLNQPFVKGQNGFPQGIPPPMDGAQAPPLPEGAKEFNLAKGKYGIAVDVGKSFQTRLQAGQEAISQLVSADPELMKVIGDLFFRFQDFPGSREIAERMKKVVGQQNPSLLDQNEPGQQAQQQLQAAQAQMQQMQQVMGEMQDALKTDKVKADADIEKTRITTSAQVQLQQMKDATAIAVAQINARTKGIISEMEDENEALATGLQHQHEMEMAEHDTAHDVAMAAMGHQNQQQAMAEGAAVEGAPVGEAPVPPEPSEAPTA